MEITNSYMFQEIPIEPEDLTTNLDSYFKRDIYTNSYKNSKDITDHIPKHETRLIDKNNSTYTLFNIWGEGSFMGDIKESYRVLSRGKRGVIVEDESKPNSIRYIPNNKSDYTIIRIKGKKYAAKINEAYKVISKRKRNVKIINRNCHKEIIEKILTKPKNKNKNSPSIEDKLNNNFSNKENGNGRLEINRILLGKDLIGSQFMTFLGKPYLSNEDWAYPIKRIDFNTNSYAVIVRNQSDPKALQYFRSFLYPNRKINLKNVFRLTKVMTLNIINSILSFIRI